MKKASEKNAMKSVAAKPSAAKGGMQAVPEKAKKMGRPAKIAPKLDEPLRFMATKETAERYRKAALQSGVDLSVWIRRACDAQAAVDLDGSEVRGG